MKKFKFNHIFLLILWSLVIIVAIITTNSLTTQVSDRYYDEKVQAAKLTQQAFDEIRLYKQELGIPIPSEDVNNTGLIGERFTKITTTLGILDRKRTAVNPNFAAVIIDMFKEINLKKGDEVAVLFTGSFPSLNIAVMSAIEIFELKPIIMASVGASSYGANSLDMTYLHMSKRLYDKKIFSNDIDYASLGGSNDDGTEFELDIKENLYDLIEEYNYQLINKSDFKENIDYRLKLMNEKVPKRKLLINVGGGLIALGKDESSYYQRNGLIQSRYSYVFSKTNANSGLIEHHIIDNKPVIQLLNIKSLSHKYNLPFDYKGVHTIGDGDVYLEYKKDILIPIIVCLGTIAVTIFYYVIDKKGKGIQNV